MTTSVPTCRPIRITVLHGMTSPALQQVVDAQLSSRGDVIARHPLSNETFGPCRGCFECWTAKPGACRANDAANQVMRDIIAADVLVFTARPRFGSWDPLCKAALDRCIGLLSPFFGTIDGETHHLRRYGRYPRWLVVAEDEHGVDDHSRTLFTQLVGRNALNMHAEAHHVTVVPSDADDETRAARIGAGLSGLLASQPMPPTHQPPYDDQGFAPARGVTPVAGRPRHALLWVGSAKPHGQSTSEAIGQHLLQLLRARGWTTDVLYAAHTIRLSRRDAPALRVAVERADLVLLAAPVYVDTLPALVLSGLGALLDHAGEARDATPPALLPIVQCGFPELSHTVLAVYAARLAAEALGWGFAGHLALGGGGMIGGRSLSKLGGRVHAQVQALADAAQALDARQPVSPATSAQFAKVAVPAFAYRWVGDVGWITTAMKHGSLLQLWDAPMEQAPAQAPAAADS